jgi:hypothetical protein
MRNKQSTHHLFSPTQFFFYNAAAISSVLWLLLLATMAMEGEALDDTVLSEFNYKV